MGGMRMSPTKDATILPKAAPITTAMASSITLPRMTNSLNSRSMWPSSRPGNGLVGLPPQERRDIQVLFGRHVGIGAGIGGHPPPPGIGRGSAAGSGSAGHVHDLPGGLAGLLPLAEAGGDHRDPHLVLEARVDDGAEDDVGFLVACVLDDPRRLLHFVQGEVGAAREVHEDAASAVYRGL